jgi:hypothetical protein
MLLWLLSFIHQMAEASKDNPGDDHQMGDPNNHDELPSWQLCHEGENEEE